MGFTVWSFALVMCICVVHASIFSSGKFHDLAGIWFVAMYLASLAKNIILAGVLEGTFVQRKLIMESKFYVGFFQ